MKAIVYDCPACGEKLEIGPDEVGRTLKCPNCNRPVKTEPLSAAPRDAVEDEEEDVRQHEQAQEMHDERTLLEVHPPLLRSHPWSVIAASILILAGLFGLIAIPLTLFDFATPLIIAIVAGVLLVIGLIWFVILYLKNLAHRLEVTTFRTRQTNGLLRKTSTEVQHDDVANLRVNQSFLERIFKVGYIGISAGDAETMEIEAHGIPDPEGIAEVIREHQNKMAG